VFSFEGLKHISTYSLSRLPAAFEVSCTPLRRSESIRGDAPRSVASAIAHTQVCSGRGGGGLLRLELCNHAQPATSRFGPATRQQQIHLSSSFFFAEMLLGPTGVET